MSTNAAYTPPGRLGDPNKTLLEDPRLHPKLRETLVALGIGTEEQMVMPETLSIEALTPVMQASDTVYEAMYNGIPHDLPGDDDEPEIQVSTQTIKGVDDNDIILYIYKPAAAAGPVPAVIYSHGGGMVFIPTDNAAHRRWVRSIAVQGVIAIAVDFRNAYTAAGHNPFPAGLNDCAAAVKYISSHRAELGISKIVLQGESGGANLAISTTLKAKREGWVGEIAGVYGNVPYISNAYHWPRERQLAELPSLVENDEYVLGTKTMASFGYYYGPNDMENPHAWPYHASVDELRGMPPVVLDMNELDPLRDEGMVFYRKLIAAGVQAEAKVSLGIAHGTPLIFRKALPEVHNAAVRDIAAFAKSL
ncbi:hypothetical protein Q7P37_004066 [Cladosporium fusiforme]